MVKRKGLGRGLDALLGIADDQPEEVAAVGVDSAGGTAKEALRDLPIEFMQRGKYQPRRDMHPDALEELANSISAQGVMQPIVVRPIGEDRYEIIAGERRWRASQQAGLDVIPAIIRDVSDEAAIAMALIENIQREDLNAIEEAQALIRLQQEFELTQEEIARAVGKSRATVANLMRLMSLQETVRTMIERGDIEMGHGRALLALDGPKQLEAARVCVARGLSVRQTEELVRKLQQPEAETVAPQKMDADTRRLQDELSDQLGVPVLIQQNARGKGKLVLKYNSLDELEGILGHIN